MLFRSPAARVAVIAVPVLPRRDIEILQSPPCPQVSGELFSSDPAIGLIPLTYKISGRAAAHPAHNLDLPRVSVLGYYMALLWVLSIIRLQ